MKKNINIQERISGQYTIWIRYSDASYIGHNRFALSAQSIEVLPQAQTLYFIFISVIYCQH
jgi:hypothetical protein